MSDEITIGDTVRIGGTSLRGQVMEIRYTDENAFLGLKILYPAGHFIAWQAYQFARKVAA